MIPGARVASESVRLHGRGRESVRQCPGPVEATACGPGVRVAARWCHKAKPQTAALPGNRLLQGSVSPSRPQSAGGLPALRRGAAAGHRLSGRHGLAQGLHSGSESLAAWGEGKLSVRVSAAAAQHPEVGRPESGPTTGTRSPCHWQTQLVTATPSRTVTVGRPNLAGQTESFVIMIRASRALTALALPNRSCSRRRLGGSPRPPGYQ